MTDLAAGMGVGPPRAHCPPARRKYVLTVAILGSSLGFIDGTIVTVAIQAIREGFGASFGAALWVVHGYTLALSAFLLVGGAAGDRFGQRRVFAAGISVFALASAACAFAPKVEVLIAARGIQGLAAAFMVPGSLALIAIHYPPAERGRAVGLWAAASGITAAMGPIVGGALIDWGSWPAVFLINIPLAALTLMLLYAKVPADVGRGSGRFDTPGAVLAFVSVGLVAAALTIAERDGLLTPNVGGLMAAGLAVFCVFLWWEHRAAVPMVPLNLFSQRTFAVANGMTLVLYFALGGTLFFLPVTLMAGHDWTAARTGAIFFPFTLAMAVVSPLSGRLVDRLGARPLLVVGPIVAASGLAVLAWSIPSTEMLWALVPAMVLLGGGMGLAIPPVAAAVLNDAGESRAGTASGINNAVSRVAGLFAVAVLSVFASALFRAASGETTAGFATPGLQLDPVTYTSAVKSAFQGVAWAGALCAATASVLALALPPMARQKA